jgi:Protein of unknown function (DUF2778)
MWKYAQATGKLTGPNGGVVGIGYSGHAIGLNDPDEECVHDFGPIPKGNYRIGHFFDDAGGKGPMVAHLTPIEGTDTFGRSGFMVHGDNHLGDHSASHGCIILSRFIREQLMTSSDRTLEVTG